MPTWTTNTITVKGERAELTAFLKAVKGPAGAFDFNRITPKPEQLRHTAIGFRTIGRRKVNSWFESDGIVRRLTAEDNAALRNIGHSDWYAYARADWGIKWNACRSRISVRRPAQGLVEIVFDTAWTAPIPIFEMMVAMFPQLSFTCSWQDDGDPETVTITYKVGGH